MTTIQKRHPNPLVRLVYCAAVLLVMSFSFPAYVHADDSVPPPDTTTTATVTEPAPESSPPPVAETPPPVSDPAPTSNPGPQEPTGAEANTYTYNESTGLWENSQYTWDPVTNQTSPKTPQTYSYNPATGRWDTTEWVYDAPSGTYIPNIISVVSVPAGAAIVEDPANTSSPARTAGTDGSAQKSTATATSHDSGSGTSPSKSTSTGVFDLFYNAFISNSISSSAITGDALVNMNTLAGDALSGNATAISTVLNLLQSVWNLGITGNLFTTFTQNLFGDILGDLWLNPGQSGGSNASTSPDNLTVNASQNAAIDNTINLEATSGDATVSSNTQAGSATSGSATVIANIINAINSSIVSGHSFLGMLNIYGNLNGDILLPQDLISTLLASNALGTLDTSQISNANILGTFNNNASTVNDVNASATSGSAAVTNNTTAGNATSGNADTNVTLLNLTGRQVIGKNALLVFVNVLGKWVGMIVDAPTGSTSAALGGGITSDSTLAIAANSNQAITNDINIAATTGNALVDSNTTAGDATSGNALAAVNILNMNGSQFALSDWFGVLFINVFGSWNGSFGIDTAAGSLPQLATAVSSSSSNPSPLTASAVRAFKFVPRSDGTYSLESSSDGVTALAAAHVLSTQDSSPSPQKNTAKLTAQPEAMQRDWTLTLITMTLGLSLLGAERAVTRRGTQKQ